MPKRVPNRSDHLRTAVAQEAARLMAEHGIQDFHLAKRKAAERYGVAEGAALPSNTEIEAALLSYQRLFGGEHHASSLREQRGIAVRAMRLLEKFDPRLVGPVLAGSATEFTDIQLHIFSDSAEAVYTHLIDRRFEYEVFERKVRMNPDRIIGVPSVRFAIVESMVEAFIFPSVGIRQAPVSPVDGKPMRRATLTEVTALLPVQPDQ
jgi:hypothetical protein